MSVQSSLVSQEQQRLCSESDPCRDVDADKDKDVILILPTQEEHEDVYGVLTGGP